MRLLRNLSRRKLRTGLTVAGIMIGIWALVIFSSMAAKMDALVSGGSRYYADKVLVSSGGTTISAGMPMQLSAGTTIAALPGVDVVAPSVELPFDTTPATVSFGPGDTITGTPAGADKGRETFDRRLASGRFLNAADEGAKVAVLGSDIASKHALTTGGTIRLRGTGFTVVGVLEPTMTAPDAAIDIPFAASRNCRNEVMVARDGEGAVRYLNHGSIPVPAEVLAYHKECLDKRERARGRKMDYQTIIDDIFSISRGALILD